jgi:hypothetical protein
MFYFHNPALPATVGEIGSLLQIMIYTMIFSIPSLLLSLLAGYLFSLLQAPVITRFLLWLFVAPLIVLLNYVLLSLVLTGGSFAFFEIQMAIPAIIAVVVVVLLRYHSFLKVFRVTNKEQDETKSVS